MLLAPHLVPLSRTGRHEAVGLLAALLLDAATRRNDGMNGALDSEIGGGFRGVKHSEAGGPKAARRRKSAGTRRT